MTKQCNVEGSNLTYETTKRRDLVEIPKGRVHAVSRLQQGTEWEP